MYAGVPRTAPAAVRSTGPSAEPGLPASGPPTFLASPQSITWTSSNWPTMTLAGLRSRWTIPREWAYPNGPTHLLGDPRPLQPFSAASGLLRQHRRQGLAVDQFHGQERAAVRKGAESAHRRDAGVGELGGDSGLFPESALHQIPRRPTDEGQLDGHLPVQDRLSGGQHHSHAPPAQSLPATRSLGSPAAHRPTNPVTPARCPGRAMVRHSHG